MGQPPRQHQSESPARPDWVEALGEQGLDPCVTASGECWIRQQRWVRMRYPPNDVGPIDRPVRRELFFRHGALVIAAHRAPADGEAANAYLYIRRDRGYDLAALSANNRSKVRRGLGRHEVRMMAAEEMREKGYACVADTERRNGLQPTTVELFRKRWERPSLSAHRRLWGALAEGEIAAFLILRRCGRWIEIESTGSSSAHLRNYPNHALFFTVLKELMSEPEVESVSYGLSSAQLETHAESLHAYKLSLGFEAMPVVREVAAHPFLRPMLNPLTRSVLRGMDRLSPGNLAIRRARALAEMLGGTERARLPQSSEPSSS
jgi:hypothetical protein